MKKLSRITTGKAESKAREAIANDSVDLAMQRLGIGIDTARYGHHASFLREDKQPACPPLTISGVSRRV